ncbi:hypothetical protein BOTBODRAFT_79550, partial [Botryobasidium botryosum FD-172 SS1]
TSEGTHNLNNGIKRCKSLVSKDDDDGGVNKKRTPTAYTPAHHRALIALRCAVSKRPFNMVKDRHYIAEVELLRPGMVVPHPSIVSSDICNIYTQSAEYVKSYFEVRGR